MPEPSSSSADVVVEELVDVLVVRVVATVFVQNPPPPTCADSEVTHSSPSSHTVAYCCERFGLHSSPSPTILGPTTLSFVVVEGSVIVKGSVVDDDDDDVGELEGFGVN